MSHVFLAAPYTQWMDWSAGELNPDRKKQLQTLRQAFIDRGHAVFSAHQNEQWGKAWLAPEICTPADFLAVSNADVMCVVVGEPPSPGVMIEIGWASALGVPIVLLQEGASAPALVAGIGEVTSTTRRGLPDEFTEEDLADIVTAVEKAASSPRSLRVAEPVVGYPKTSLPNGYEAVERPISHV
jgi:nucleoside 2-deoxyribosyltransferase